MAHPPRIFWVLLLIGLGLRLGAIELRPLDTITRAPDEYEYYQLARNMAAGQGFTLEGHPLAYRSVLFPAVASAAFFVLGPSPRPVLYLNALLSVLTALLLYRLTGWRFGERAALLAGGLWLFFPGVIVSCALFATSTLFAFLWVLTLSLYDRLEARGFYWRDAVLMGLAVGATTLTRVVGLTLLTALILYLSFIRPEPWRSTEWRMAAVVLAVCALVVVPWLVRHNPLVDNFTVNTNSAGELLLDSPARVSGERPLPRPLQPEGFVPHRFSGELQTAVDDSLLPGADAANRSILWRHKLARIWSTDVSLWTRYTLREAPTAAVDRLRHVPLWPLLLSSLPLLICVAASAGGFILSRHFPSRGLLLLQMALALAAIFLTYGVPRDYFPFLPMLTIGSAALGRGPRWSRITRPRWAAALALLLLLGGSWYWSARLVAEW